MECGNLAHHSHRLVEDDSLSSLAKPTVMFLVQECFLEEEGEIVSGSRPLEELVRTGGGQGM